MAAARDLAEDPLVRRGHEPCLAPLVLDLLDEPPESTHEALTEAQIDAITKWIDAGAPWSMHWSHIICAISMLLNRTFSNSPRLPLRRTTSWRFRHGSVAGRSVQALLLLSLGISASRIKTISYGEEKPFCTQHNEGCWQENRRGRFTITGRS